MKSLKFFVEPFINICRKNTAEWITKKNQADLPNCFSVFRPWDPSASSAPNTLSSSNSSRRNDPSLPEQTWETLTEKQENMTSEIHWITSCKEFWMTVEKRITTLKNKISSIFLVKSFAILNVVFCKFFKRQLLCKRNCNDVQMLHL